MSTAESSRHFSNGVAARRKAMDIVALYPEATTLTERELSAIEPLSANHYVDEFSVRSSDGSRSSLIDVHHIGRTGLPAIFPTIIRLIEFNSSQVERQVDIFSIDSNGYVLAHTNTQIKGEERIESKDNSLERLAPYEDELIERSQLYPLTAMNRILNAFSQHEAVRKGA